KQAMLAQQEALRQQQMSWQEAQSRVQNLEQWCRQVAARLETLSYQEKRRAMLTLGVQAYVYRLDHEARYEVEITPLEGIYGMAATRAGKRIDSVQYPPGKCKYV